MKKLISCLIATAALLSGLGAAVSAADEGTVLYVSPTGDNSAAGDINHPLADLTGAKNAVHNLRANGTTGSVTVYIRGGEYRISDTITFDSADSDTAYVAYPGETPIFTGGYRIPASEFEDVTLENGTTVKKINIKSYLMEKMGVDELDEKYYHPLVKDCYGYGDTTATGGKTGYEDVPVYSTDDNAALWIARYPNKKEGFYEDNPHTVFLTTGAATQNDDTYSFAVTDEKILKYAGTEDVWYSGFPTNLFFDRKNKVTVTDNGDGTGAITFAPGYVVKEGYSYFVFNILNELDQPGEYYVTHEGVLYFLPNGSFNYFNVGALSSEYMITTNGASNLTFKGLHFENTRGDGIYIYGGEDNLIDSCDFRNIGGTAVTLGRTQGEIGWYTQFATYEWTDWFGSGENRMNQQKAALHHYNRWAERSKTSVRGRHNGITNSVIKNTGTYGVSVSGGNACTDDECEHFIDNCDISFPGVNKRTYCGAVLLNNCFGVSITNNEISHTSATAISGYLAKGLIENNEIYDGLSESTDMGLIYLNYQCIALDLRINHNYLHDVPSEVTITDENVASSQRSAIALDNGYGQGLKVTNNVIENIPKGTWLYPCETLENNYFINCYNPLDTRNINEFNSWRLTADFSDYETNKAAMATGTADNYGFIYVLPVFIQGETADGNSGDKIRALWNEKYPEVMQWLDIIDSGVHKGRMFGKYRNNLFVNSEDHFWYSSHVYLGNVFTASTEMLGGKFESISKNNTYRTNTKCFVDYEGGDYNLTRSAKIRLKIDSIDISTIGRQTK